MNAAQEKAHRRLLEALQAINNLPEDAGTGATLGVLHEREAAEQDCRDAGFSEYQIAGVKKGPNTFHPTFHLPGATQ
jgi:hypothetical protein